MQTERNASERGLLDRARAAVDWVQRRRAVSPVIRPPVTPDGPLADLKVLVTAEEAFPEFERLVLGARTSLTCGFRIFDPTTSLLSRAAREVGDTWEDLIADALRRGVHVRVFLSDFDPVAAPGLHCGSWSSVRRLRERAEKEGHSDRLEAHVHMHAAQSGYLIRLAAAWPARRTLRDMAKDINAKDPAERDAYLIDVPHLATMFRRRPDGSVRVARSVIPPMRPVTHHQKIAVIDRTHLYIGGLDLDDRRADDKGHETSAGQTWADVQISFSGAIAAEAEDHLLAFRDEVSAKIPPALTRSGFLRTLSVRRRNGGLLHVGPKPVVSELIDQTLLGVHHAERLIYLETQYLRDLHFARDLARRGHVARNLRLMVVLPAAPEELAFQGARGMDTRFGEHLQARCIEILARGFGDRASFFSPAQPRGLDSDGSRAVLCGAPIIYVHSKVSIFDESMAVVSSANLNGRSHRWDTEAGVALKDPDQIRHLRDRLMRHWLPADPDPEMLDPDNAPSAWRALADQNQACEPRDRRGFLLPYALSAPRRFGRPIPFLTQNLM